MFCTYIGQVKSAVGVEDDREDGEGKFQDGKLEGAQFEQEETASGAREVVGGGYRCFPELWIITAGSCGHLEKKNMCVCSDPHVSSPAFHNPLR